MKFGAPDTVSKFSARGFVYPLQLAKPTAPAGNPASRQLFSGSRTIAISRWKWLSGADASLCAEEVRFEQREVQYVARQLLPPSEAMAAPDATPKIWQSKKYRKTVAGVGDPATEGVYSR